MRLRLVVLIAVAALLQGAAGTLSLLNLTISDSDGGASLPSSYAHVPGETLFLSFQVAGYKASAADKVHLSYKIDAYDPHGVRIVEPVASEIEDSLAPEDKNWKPTVRQEIQVPPLADSGVYKIAVSLNDEIGHTAASQEVTFTVRGHPVEPSDTLVIRNFRFYRGEQDTEPLQKAAYRPGDPVWARFDITGFKYGEDHAIQVSYGVAVIAPSGKELWSQAEAAVEKSQSFYPKRYVPGSMSLKLQPNIRPGEYGMLISAHDLVGNQTCELRQNFSIE